ncbi:hypothetical protein [Gordonia sp. 'Campus']|uniref:hypothetical protein n=1 Tax=Gordonia sp. 'Campus' TaxID=2915824 RepID=UPI001EE41EF6|nr:hypothetical protein [Gordonia sp. 'Campus']
MSIATATRQKRTAKTELRCEHCGAEAQILTTPDELDSDIVNQIDEWNEQHEKCSEPLAARVISELDGRFAEARKDMTVTQVLEEGRPSWSTWEGVASKGKVMAHRDFSWQSHPVRIPARRYRGTIQSDGKFAVPEHDLRLHQRRGESDAIVAIRRYWPTKNEDDAGYGWGHEPVVALTLDEADAMAEILQTLVSLARAEQRPADEAGDHR